MREATIAGRRRGFFIFNDTIEGPGTFQDVVVEEEEDVTDSEREGVSVKVYQEQVRTTLSLSLSLVYHIQ